MQHIWFCNVIVLFALILKTRWRSIIPIRNDWLGAELVTVTGLVPARDVVTQLKTVQKADAIYLSYRMFSEDGITLDDHTREDIENKLNIPVYIHHEDMLEILNPWT